MESYEDSTLLPEGGERDAACSRGVICLENSHFLWLEDDGGDKTELKVTAKRKYALPPLEILVCFVFYSHSVSCSGFDASTVKKSFYFHTHKSEEKELS